MAKVNIETEINKITKAILGEEVRGAIKDALILMNKELGKGATKVAPTEVDTASECIAEGTFYKVLIDGTPSIITTSLDAGGTTGVQYRFASTGSGSAGAIYYRTFTVNPFSAGEWINVSAAIDETTLEGIVDRYLETIGIDDVVERKENKTTYNVTAYTDIYSDSTAGPSIDIEASDDSKYPSLKAVKQLTGACIFSMPEMFKKETDPDDTKSIQKAINYAVRRNIPFRCAKNKEYIISSPITIRIVPNYFGCVEFDFCNATLRMDNELQQDCILKYTSGVASNEETIYPHAVVKNVVLDGYFESAETGLYIQHSNGDIFENIMVYNTIRGIYVLAGSETRITNCTIRRNIVKVYDPDTFYTMGRKAAYGLNNESATTWECEITPAKIKGVAPNASDVVYWDDEYSGSEEGTSYSAIAEYQNGDVVYTSGGKKWQLHSPNGSTIVNFQPKSSNTSGKIIWTNKGKYKDLDVSVEESSEDKITLEDGSTIIDPNTTNFVGIDCREDSTDMWVENCVIINYVVGIAVRSGDTKIIACHPWISGKNIVKTAIAYYNKGTNYYSDCTCDIFKIGFYCGNNAPIYLTNTHISSKPTSATVAAFEAYCFYIPSTVYHKGSEIHAVNTKIHGIKDSWTTDTNENTKNIVIIPKNWTNIPGGCISDVNTSGYGVLNYLNSNLNDGETFKRIKQPASPNNIVEGSINLLKCTGYDFSSQTNIVAANELVTHDSGYQNRAGNIYTSGLTWATFKDEDVITHCLYAPDGQIASNTVAREIILGNFSALNIYKKALISFRYETNWTGPAHIRVTNMSGETYSSGILYNIEINPNSTTKLVRLLVDFTKNESNNYVDQKVSIVFDSTIGRHKFVNSKDTSDDEYYFYFWEVNAFDLSNVPQYYLENSGDYTRRIYQFINGNMPDSNVVSLPIVANLAVSAKVDMRLKSEKIKLNLNRYIVPIQDTDPIEYENYIGEDASGYIIRYNEFGFPVIRKSNSMSHQNGIYAIVPVHLQKSIGIFESQIEKCLSFMDVDEDLSPIFGTEKSALSTDITHSYMASNKYIAIKMLFNSTNNTNANIVSLRFGNVYLEPDTRLAAPGEVIKCYPEGEIYAVGLNTVTAATLPTFAYTLEDI